MIGASSLALLMRLIAALMLATIGVHAAAPASQPLERGHGSAFSAATYNVSLKIDRRTDALETLAIEPVGDGVTDALVPQTATRADERRPRSAYRAQAPPPAPDLIRPSPRGPPSPRH